MYIGRHVKRQLFLSVLVKPEFSRHILEKYTNIKCSENSSIGSRIVPYGRADRRRVNDTANSRLAQFCELA